ncbi:MAG: hypothetical protein KDA27_07200 [Candidatus Eisenbacteria bacterium]|uniref:YvlB/LiaX N-terminal domain-containing protein n=1 Tax=Eiseniibacteriota bacterium TaxID=2212470 RepID=A0A956SCP7_UNCEI|nr:hypothetical protein [Candidatus Eisenbacteria bacterium]MCB9465548.1 hypothetical protein [Candidatus Eisenbacteria bacterium]
MTFPKEYRQILDMLGEGKITAEEAQRLMEKLGGSTQRGSDAGRSDAGAFASSEEAAADAGVRTAVLVQPGGGTGSSGGKGTMPKYLRILVNSSDGDEVNIRVPLQLVRAGLKLSTVLPNDAKEKITEKGIDLSKLGELEGEALIEALRELSVDVDSSDGDVVRIFCE